MTDATHTTTLQIVEYDEQAGLVLREYDLLVETDGPRLVGWTLERMVMRYSGGDKVEHRHRRSPAYLEQLELDLRATMCPEIEAHIRRVTGCTE